MNLCTVSYMEKPNGSQRTVRTVQYTLFPGHPGNQQVDKSKQRQAMLFVQAVPSAMYCTSTCAT